MGIERREYKVMLDHREFRYEHAIPAFWTDVSVIAEAMKIETAGELEQDKVQDVFFLDTPDHTIRKNGLVLRRRDRQDKDRIQLTLKRRSPDRFIAEDANLTMTDGLGDTRKSKVEEDIAAPFRSRYSHSATITFKNAADNPPAIATLQDAVEMFPALRELQHDRLPCALETPLAPVNQLRVNETVFANDRLEIGPDAEAGLILWARFPHLRLIAAEFSFRYKHDEDEGSIDVAQKAMGFFRAIQRLAWSNPQARTKTQFAYGDDATG